MHLMRQHLVFLGLKTQTGWGVSGPKTGMATKIRHLVRTAALVASFQDLYTVTEDGACAFLGQDAFSQDGM